MVSIELTCPRVADYLTGGALVDSIVRLKNRVIQWLTRHSGIKADSMAIVIAQACQDLALNSRKEAREVLRDHIDSKTVPVCHAFRMVHTRVVDSAILTLNAIEVDSMLA